MLTILRYVLSMVKPSPANPLGQFTYFADTPIGKHVLAKLAEDDFIALESELATACRQKHDQNSVGRNNFPSIYRIVLIKRILIITAILVEKRLTIKVGVSLGLSPAGN
jgi:hypothetical protein